MLVCVLLAAVTLAVFWQVRLHDFINYDDQDYVTANAPVQRGITWEGLLWAFQTNHAANWHPLTWLSHMLDAQLFGLNPAGHHLTNVFFHIANTILLFLLLRRATGATGRSAVVAGLFALHPLHVESVAWVAERKDVLSTFFGLLALGAYCRYAEVRGGDAEGRNPKAERTPKSETRSQRPGPQVPHPPGLSHRPASSVPHPALRPWYALSLVFFAFSLMSKPMLVTLPFLMLLLDWWPLDRWRPAPKPWGAIRPLLLEKVPFLVLAALSGLATLLVQQAAMTYYRQLPLGFRVANAAISYARYLGKTFWPVDLAVFYPHPVRWSALAVTGSVLLVILISALAWWGSRRRPYLLAGWLWFLGLLVPVLGVVQVGVQAMADRYTYLPLVGIFIMLAWGSADCLGAGRLWTGLGVAAGSVTLVLCAALTCHQLRFWRNTETIFKRAIAVTRDNWVAHSNLALLALLRYQDTQRGSPAQQVVSLDSARSGTLPGYSATRDFLGEVIFHCQATLRANLGFPDARITMAKALTEMGQLDEARAQLEIVLRLDPKSADARENLAEILLRQGRVADAINEYRAALKLKPDWQEVLNNLAWLLATHPRPEIRNGLEAVSLAERACALTSHTNFWFLQTLAAAHAERGNFGQAVASAEEARRLAIASGQSSPLATAERRLQLYRSGQPYREP